TAPAAFLLPDACPIGCDPDIARRRATCRSTPMNPIAELLPATNVIANLDVGSKSELFAAFGRLFENGNELRGDQVAGSLRARARDRRRGAARTVSQLGAGMTGPGSMMRQVSVERFFADNEARLGLSWLAGRQGGNRVLTGDAALKPTIGQVGHMNFIHPFRI